MPLRLFRSRNVAGANLVQALLVVGMFGMFFLGALYMQQILGYDALEVGLAFLPATVVMGDDVVPLLGALIMRFGPKATLIPSIVRSAPGCCCSRARRSTASSASTSCPRWSCSASAPAWPSPR